MHLLRHISNSNYLVPVAKTPTYRIKSIGEFHRLRGLPQPEHPLISIINYADIQHNLSDTAMNVLFEFYSISIKKGIDAKLKYGQQTYDFDEGIMFFMAPGQTLRIEPMAKGSQQRSGWMLLMHPDFLWNTPLAKNIHLYEYFDYAVHEALFLSDKEEATLQTIIQHIQQEYTSTIDKFSQNIIIAQVETLLNYAERFYQRQFITRKKSSHHILQRLEQWLNDYFYGGDFNNKGMPAVTDVAAALHVSSGYLSSMLKVHTGRSTQQHIQDKLVEIAKQRLSGTNLSVTEIAYELGFEHPQSFSKFFKTKTQLSPLAFRQSFN